VILAACVAVIGIARIIETRVNAEKEDRARRKVEKVVNQTPTVPTKIELPPIPQRDINKEVREQMQRSREDRDEFLRERNRLPNR
jgi:predicted metal-dependent RNase